MPQAKAALPQRRIVVVGDVDHGKSTLIGRLLFETGSLTTERIEGLRVASARRGEQFEWSFALDALQSERDQAVTVDTTRVWLRLPTVEIVLIDAPGHVQFIRNMVTGSSDAQIALLVVDVTLGVTEQTRRHLLLLELLGIQQCLVVVNKMDAIDYREAPYTAAVASLASPLEQLGIAALGFIPISAREGVNLVQNSPLTTWYRSVPLVEAMQSVRVAQPDLGPSPRMFVQGVLRRGERRVVLGHLDAGALQVGEEILVMPAQQRVRIASIETWPHGSVPSAVAHHAVALTADGQQFIERGDLIVGMTDPPALHRRFSARLAWLGERTLRAGMRCEVRVGTRVVGAHIESIERVVDATSLAALGASAARTGDLVDATVHLAQPLPFELGAAGARLRRCILLDGTEIVGAGQFLQAATTVEARPVLFAPTQLVTRRLREQRNGHTGCVIWLTGLPASGKSTLAAQWERALFDRHRAVYVLDGDRLRGGLCADLGFSAQDRTENIRRASEIAALFADAGFIVIAAFISPNRVDREIARRVIGEAFREVYIKADLEACEQRDPKGLYARARSGALANFTGVGADYEPPANPDEIIDTMHESLQTSVERGLRFIESVLASTEARTTRSGPLE